MSCNAPNEMDVTSSTAPKSIRATMSVPQYPCHSPVRKSLPPSMPSIGAVKPQPCRGCRQISRVVSNHGRREGCDATVRGVAVNDGSREGDISSATGAGTGTVSLLKAAVGRRSKWDKRHDRCPIETSKGVEGRTATKPVRPRWNEACRFRLAQTWHSALTPSGYIMPLDATKPRRQRRFIWGWTPHRRHAANPDGTSHGHSALGRGFPSSSTLGRGDHGSFEAGVLPTRPGRGDGVHAGRPHVQALIFVQSSLPQRPSGAFE